MSSKRNKKELARPLSAYNFFFKEERAKLVQQSLREGNDAIIAEAAADGGPKDGGKESGTNIFGCMGKIIGKRWKQLPKEQRCKFEDLARNDLLRYKRERKAYRKRMHQQPQPHQDSQRATSAPKSRADSDNSSPAHQHNMPGQESVETGGQINPTEAYYAQALLPQLSVLSGHGQQAGGLINVAPVADVTGSSVAGSSDTILPMIQAQAIPPQHQIHALLNFGQFLQQTGSALDQRILSSLSEADLLRLQQQQEQQLAAMVSQFSAFSNKLLNPLQLQASLGLTPIASQTSLPLSGTAVPVSTILFQQAPAWAATTTSNSVLNDHSIVPSLLVPGGNPLLVAPSEERSLQLARLLRRHSGLQDDSSRTQFD